jgi:aminopeptidase
VSSEGWARIVHTDSESETALDRLWADVAFTCRLDEADPVRAWRERAAELTAVADALTRARLDELRIESAGTDLRIGLFPRSTWLTAWLKTVDGLPHMANFPSEEVFSVPDPSRVEGNLTIAQPLIVRQNLVLGLTLSFSGGRICALRQTRARTSCAQSSRLTKALRDWARSRWSTAKAASHG